MTDKTERAALVALADRIEALAFKMPAPNEWTPQFVSLAVNARHQALAAQPAASVDVERLRRFAIQLERDADGCKRDGYEQAEAVKRDCAFRLSQLIDSAGGAKVDPWATLVALADALDIDPAKARKASGKPSDVYLEAARRKFATPQPAEGDGAVDEAMVDRAIRAFENEPAYHTDDDWDRRCMRAALTAALAQQEPRHD